jgi:tRNA(fMet)-specific endonuclease VapC
MDFIVIDTDVVSYLFKGDTRGDLYAPYLEDSLGVLSFMTIAELDFWADARNWGEKKRAELETFLKPYIVIESNRELCRQWAALNYQVQRSGYHIETADAWIAATALLYNVPLVTHNRSHFTHVNGLNLISESPT